MAALWVWSLACWIEAHTQNNNRLSLLSAALCGLCWLTKYNGVITLIPVLLLYSLLAERRLSSRCLYLLVSVLMVCGYRWGSQVLYGKDVIAQTVGFTLSTQSFGVLAIPEKRRWGLSSGYARWPHCSFSHCVEQKSLGRMGNTIFGAGHHRCRVTLDLRIQWALWALAGTQFLVRPYRIF